MGRAHVEYAADEELLVGGEIDSWALVDVGIFDSYGLERRAVVVCAGGGLGLHLCAGRRCSRCGHGYGYSRSERLEQMTGDEYRSG